MDNPFARASLAGAMDLSALKAKAERRDAPAAPVAASPTGPTASTAPGLAPNQVPVRSLVIDAGIENLRELLSLSNEVPVLVDFKTTAVPGSAELTLKLERFAIEANGKFILARVDAEKQPEILEAFQLRQGGIGVALLKGQPVPLISADLDEAEMLARLSRVYEIAEQQGMLGLAVVTEGAPAAPAPALPPRHQAAFDLIDQGDYDGAIAQYEAALREMPTDTLATAGLAQVKLLKRVEGLDFAAVLSSEPSPEDGDALAATLTKADACISTGHLEFGMNLVLDRFAVQFGDRDALRARLLEYFTILGDIPEVAAARKRLTGLLY